ncbi:hypothetical protein BD779DRAFT_1669978 [Infundibulicybe gibba]|nr:hypothetical protein BD779DRAFT_1669978 [Infundibulicybe gibba]
MSTSVVNDFLLSSKEAFLRNPADGKTTIVMGNEAGDLDSLASAIAYAWILSNTATPTPAVALIQTPPAGLALRPENTHALAKAGVLNPLSTLLTPAALPPLPPTTPIALVNHNTLSPAFPRPDNVVAILDHHADEGQHLNASPRTVAPAGSAASHVAAHLPPHAPKEIAILLLSAILLVTNGLQPGGCALDVDRTAASALAVRAGLLPDALTGPGEIHEVPALRDLTGTLKTDVEHMTALEWLRYDYEECDVMHGGANVRFGFSNVPLPLSMWGANGVLRKAAEEHMRVGAAEEHMEVGMTFNAGVLGVTPHVLVVLTSSVLGVTPHPRMMRGKAHNKDKEHKSYTAGGGDENDDEDVGKEDEKLEVTSRAFGASTPSAPEVKPPREMAWLIAPSSWPPSATLAARLRTGLEAHTELRLTPHADPSFTANGEEGNGGMYMRAYEQGNTDADRNVIAPLVLDIIKGTSTCACVDVSEAASGAGTAAG